MAKNSEKKGTRKENTTYKRLEGLPFKFAAEAKEAEDKIRHQVWRRLTEAKAFDELIEKPEFANVKKELEAGLSYAYGVDGEKLLKVFSQGQGILVAISKSFSDSIGKNENKMFESMLRAASDSFGDLYYRTKGLLPPRDSQPGSLEK